MKAKSVGRRVLRGLAVLAILLCLAWLIGPRLAAPYLRGQLERMVSRHLNARLVMDDFRYEFPYGLRAKNAALHTWDQTGAVIELIKVKELELVLAQPPWKEGPLKIERIIIQEPSVQVTKTDEGLEGWTGISKPRSGNGKDPGKEKPSDYFRLRRFEIHRGRMVYLDRRTDTGQTVAGADGAAAKAGGPEPMVWSDLNVELDANPLSGSRYGWEVATRNPPMTVGSARGTVDVDSGALDVERLVWAVRAREGQKVATIPPALAEALVKYEVEGTLTVNAEGRLWLADPARSEGRATVELRGAGARLPGAARRVDRVALKLTLAEGDESGGTPPGAADPGAAETTQPVARAGGTGSATRPATRPVMGPKPAGAPPPRPVVRVELANLEIGRGDTTLRVDQGRALIDVATGRWSVAELAGRLEVGRERACAPGKLGEVLEQLQASGLVRWTAAASGPLAPDDDRPLAEQIDFEALAFPRDVTLTPKNWPMPLTGVAGTVRLTPRVISFENMEAWYGADRWLVALLRLPLEGIAHEVQVREIAGTALMSGKEQEYPRPLGGLFKTFRPWGTWYVSGNWARRLKPTKEKPEFWFDVVADGKAGILLTERRVPVDEVRAEITATPTLVDVHKLEGKPLGGTMRVDLKVVPKGAGDRVEKRYGNGAEPAGPPGGAAPPGAAAGANTGGTGTGADAGAPAGAKASEPASPWTFHGSGRVQDLDLSLLGRYLAADGKPPPKRLTGRGSLTARFSGHAAEEGKSVKDQLRASGRFDITDGEFWETPVLSEIAAGSRVSRDTLTAGDAAGRFTIEDGAVNLKDVTVSSPVLGVQGDGRVGLDGTLKLHAVAAPLSDWKEGMKKTGIPVLSDVAGELLGGLQKILNAASRTLLYEFRVEGTLKDHKVIAVPTPALTDGLAQVFGGMLKGKKAGQIVSPDEGK